MLNTWEAVYFDHDLDRLTALADAAAEVGVERFVLDDGWFRGRRDDTAGLGDWYVDETVWPDGLGPLIERVHGLGMQFGLWFEPEMVNLDSELARAHPEWILGRRPGAGAARAAPVRARPRAPRCLRLHARADRRPRRASTPSTTSSGTTTATCSRPVQPPTGSARACTRRRSALYRLLDELRARHPGAGDRDLLRAAAAASTSGILERTDRVWA